jgi:hypothetical protein
MNIFSNSASARCGCLINDCSASLHAAKVAGQHERSSPPVAVNTLRRSAELSDTSFERGADNGTRPGFDQEAARPSAKDRPGRPGRRRLPAGFLAIDDLVEAGEAKSTLYRHVKTGRLPAHQWRGRIVVAETDYQAWLDVTPLRNPAAAAANAKGAPR